MAVADKNPVISALNKTNEQSCKSELGKIKNNKVYSTILEGSETMEDNNEPSRTELDSHANMPVIGRNAYILSKIDRIPSTTPGAEPPRGTKDSGSARSHSTHLETSFQKRP